VVIHDIGIPEDLLARGGGVAVTPPPVLPRRKRDAHKGDFGRLFILAGSEGYTGAPVLASRAAVRAGAGLVTLAVPREIYPIVAVKCDEAMPWPLPDDDTAIVNKASACDLALIGPGLGQGERAQALVLRLLRELTCPVILDADGLNILSRHIDVLDARRGITILTPHDGEFARLSGCPLPVVDRLSTARDFGEKHRCVLVLKGHRTITAAGDGRCFVNTTGNPGMARGGSGDALAGLMAGLLVQTPDDLDAVLRAVWLHGRAGDLAAAEKGEYGMTVGDLIEQIPYAMKECEEA
jgi:NAD(P)H-hydrate epimerase